MIAMTQREKGENLIIVAAVERYASMHNISVVEAFDLFKKYNLFKILRENYDTLHTQDLFEGAFFADDYIARQTA
jgi:hypothetical protein